MNGSQLYESHDRSFDRLVDYNEALAKLHTGCSFAEGPAYFDRGRYLLWSDIPGNRMFRYDEADGTVCVFRQPSGHANGNTVDRRGRLITCEHGGRRVSRTEDDGSIATIVDSWRGKRLNSPNDVVVKSDESIWFTDPTYGIDNNYGAPKSESEIGGCFVYRVDPTTGDMKAVITDMVMPNGLAFSPDESKLYVVDSGRTHGADLPAHIRVFDVKESGRVSGGDLFVDSDGGIFDGLRVDSEGGIWTSAADGVHCFGPDRTLLGKIKTPEVVGNLAFGGPRRTKLYICGTTSLYAVNLRVSGDRTY
jgi:gluconolactonase